MRLGHVNVTQDHYEAASSTDLLAGSYFSSRLCSLFFLLELSAFSLRFCKTIAIFNRQYDKGCRRCCIGKATNQP